MQMLHCQIYPSLDWLIIINDFPFRIFFLYMYMYWLKIWGLNTQTLIFAKQNIEHIKTYLKLVTYLCLFQKTSCEGFDTKNNLINSWNDINTLLWPKYADNAGIMQSEREFHKCVPLYIYIYGYDTASELHQHNTFISNHIVHKHLEYTIKLLQYIKINQRLAIDSVASRAGVGSVTEPTCRDFMGLPWILRECLGRAISHLKH